MDPALKTRLIGASVLVAIAVIVVPMFFPGEPPETSGGQSVSLDIPPAPDSELKTRTLSVAPSGSTAAAAAPSDKLATVDIPSRRPLDVHPENDAVASASTAAPAVPSPQPSSPPAAAQNPPPAPDTQAAAAPRPEPAPPPKKPQPEPSSAPGAAAHGDFAVSLGAYADSANAQKLVDRVRKLGYPVAVQKVRIAGKPAAKVEAGPFATRAAAETARLKLKSAIPGAPAALVASSRDQQNDAPASALPAGRAGGWAVQIGAYSHKADAEAQQKKLRAAGFDGYVDDVRAGGRTLWRVRVGPQTQRSAAEQIRGDLKSKLHLDGVVVTVP